MCAPMLTTGDGYHHSDKSQNSPSWHRYFRVYCGGMLIALGARDFAEMTQVKAYCMVHTVYIWFLFRNYGREVVSIILVWTFYLK